jgi:hypothetical protein
LVTELREQTVIEQLARRLAEKFDEVPPSTVEDVVRSQYAKFDGRPVRDYVPLFVERHATSELLALPR